MNVSLTSRAQLALLHDVTASIAAWVLAYSLRFNFDIPSDYVRSMLWMLAWVLPLQAVIFYASGMYRGLWRYASLPDMKRIVAACAIASLGVTVVLYMVRTSVLAVPRSVLVLDPILLIVIMAGSRLAYRGWKEHRLYGPRRQLGKPVLVLGAGDAAVSLVKELSRSQEWRVVGLLDDDVNKHGHLLQDVKVLGKLSEAGNLAQELEVEHVIIAMPLAAHSVRRRAMEICSAARLHVLTVPSFEDLMSGKVTVSQIRKVEVEDLLGREAVQLDMPGLHGLLCGQVVMVTGAGGSIGAELCRQIAQFKPRLLVLFELSEFALYRMEQEFTTRYPEIRVVCAVGDVKSAPRVEQILSAFSPGVIFHAAAYKHVPLMEEVNSWEAVRNNVLGTYVLARAAMAHEVRKFVLISTDKAVNPTNVMGASKRLAEIVCQGLQKDAGLRFAMVRFGNVLGSTGSVIPKFHAQIAAGGPVTVTDRDVIRYFMSIPEAAQLVLQAGQMSVGGEIFVMDMGEPVRIVELARDMIRLSGLTEDDVKIVYTGLRPGEKLFEELLTDDEHTLSTPHPKLRIAKARPVDAEWLERLLDWLQTESVLDDDEVRQQLARWVPEYAAPEADTTHVTAQGAV